MAIDFAAPRSRVDLHAHLAPSLGDDVCARLHLTRSDRGLLLLEGHAVGPPELYDPSRLVAHLDEHVLDRAVVSMPPPFFRQAMGEQDAAAWVEAANDGLRAATARSERLLALGYLPLEHPQLAVREFARLSDQGGWAGFCGAAGGASASLAGDGLRPLWRALDADGSLLLLHPATSPDERLAEFYLHNLLGNPVETAIAAAQLVFGDVLPRHPRMRILLVHCGGCVPDLVPRWDRGVETARPGLRPLTEAPSTMVRRFYVDCLVHDSGALDRAVEVFGEDRMVLGTDWPFPMGADDPVGLVAHRGEEFGRRVAVENARALLSPLT